MDFFHELTYWHWLIVCSVLLLMEMLTGGGFLLCIALSALLTAILSGCISWTWSSATIFFSAFSVVACVFWGWYLRNHVREQPSQNMSAQLNKRGMQYVGRVFNLSEAIVNGRGKISVDDTVWRVQGPDLPKGAKVRVEGVESGVILLVKPAE